ncbi:AAA family ATPase [Endozoicomonas lisbonensis]|uniref:MoxR-like ATPase n=1 Tax=Endozoicomonas lisbonensis TaxID=3120522 RepID=A0ABV2SBK7_9GAMM
MDCRQQLLSVEHALNQAVIGQHEVARSLIIAMLCRGNVLLEGMPGLAKTRAIKTLATLVEGSFSRIQFTPDMLPSDVTGTEIYLGAEQGFEFRKGPIFGNLILVDEINRAPAKVQAALLEAMEERQVTVAGHTHPLPAFFLTLATQNPVEQEGTYTLPEAQLDRFLLKVQVNYPGRQDEIEVLRIVREEKRLQTATAEEQQAIEPLSQEAVSACWKAVNDVYVSEAVEQLIVDLIHGTREPTETDASLTESLRYGASPRGSLALEHTARAQAWLEGRDHVIPEDVIAMAKPTLRHRIALSYKAQMLEQTADSIIDTLIDGVLRG